MKASYLEKKWVVGPFQCNCRLLVCPESGEAALVDPGDEAQRILKELDGLKLANGVAVKLKYLLHTHGHLDHISASRTIKEKLATQTPSSHSPIIALHQGDEPIYLALKKQGEMFRLKYDDPLPVDMFLEHEQELQVGKLKFNVIHNPGHSPGSVSLRLNEDSSLGVKEMVLTGDTLFQGSVGRTDLWGANQDQMFGAIRDRLLTLDGDTRICPGHGPDSSIGVEKHSNPFLQ